MGIKCLKRNESKDILKGDRRFYLLKSPITYPNYILYTCLSFIIIILKFTISYNQFGFNLIFVIFFCYHHCI